MISKNIIAMEIVIFQHFPLFYPTFIYVLPNDVKIVLNIPVTNNNQLYILSIYLISLFANYFGLFHEIKYSFSSFTLPTNIKNFITLPPYQTYVLLVIILEHIFDVKNVYQLIQRPPVLTKVCKVSKIHAGVALASYNVIIEQSNNKYGFAIKLHSAFV